MSCRPLQRLSSICWDIRYTAPGYFRKSWKAVPYHWCIASSCRQSSLNLLRVSPSTCKQPSSSTSTCQQSSSSTSPVSSPFPPPPPVSSPLPPPANNSLPPPPPVSSPFLPPMHNPLPPPVSGPLPSLTDPNPSGVSSPLPSTLSTFIPYDRATGYGRAPSPEGFDDYSNVGTSYSRHYSGPGSPAYSDSSTLVHANTLYSIFISLHWFFHSI